MMNSYSVLALLGVLALSSCSSDSSTDAGSANTPVIEAYLKVGQPVSVKISTIIAYGSGSSADAGVDALDVSVTTDNMVHRLSPAGGGTYVDSTLIVAGDKTYALTVAYNGVLVTAHTAVPLKPENFQQSTVEITLPAMESNRGSGTPPALPDPVKLSWTNTDGTYYVVIIENMEADPIAVNSSTDRPARVFRNAPSQSSSYNIGPMQFQYLGKHRLILFHLHPEYAALFNENGDNSLNLKEPATNIVNGLGIFTATNSDTLYLNVKK